MTCLAHWEGSPIGDNTVALRFCGQKNYRKEASMAKRKHRLKVLSTPNPVEGGLKKESLAEVFPGIEAGSWPESSEVNAAVADATVDLSTASAYLRDLSAMDDVPDEVGGNLRKHADMMQGLCQALPSALQKCVGLSAYVIHAEGVAHAAQLAHIKDQLEALSDLVAEATPDELENMIGAIVQLVDTDLTRHRAATLFMNAFGINPEKGKQP